jgi:hypothetical protein
MNARDGSAFTALFDEPGCVKVQFKRNGDTWKYRNIPASIVEGLRQADSMGKYFNTNIRNAYPAIKREGKGESVMDRLEALQSAEAAAKKAKAQAQAARAAAVKAAKEEAAVKAAREQDLVLAEAQADLDKIRAEKRALEPQEQISFRVYPAQKDAIQVATKAADVTQQDWLFNAVSSALNKVNK